MTTIYVPEPIESAEQAAALPVGTVAMSAQPGGGVWRKRTPDSWVKASMTPSLWTNEGMANRDAAITALVPVEVEVEYIRESGGRRREKTLYVSPWKDTR